MTRPLVLALLAVAVLACGQEQTVIYVYPDGWQPRDAVDEPDALAWSDEGVDPGGKDSAAADPGPTDNPAPVPEASPDVEAEAAALPDVGDTAEYWPEGVLALPEVLEPVEVVVPDAPTHDCDPLGIPEAWSGTFDGDIVSNMPDVGDYTFNGPVYGDIGFTIACYNTKYVVQGQLNGGASNCALATGCPFVATMSGYYDPATKTIEGTLVNGSIDFSVVKVLAEGSYVGYLGAGTTLEGTWQGKKTGITPTSLSWVQATGSGTWEASPAP